MDENFMSFATRLLSAISALSDGLEISGKYGQIGFNA